MEADYITTREEAVPNLERLHDHSSTTDAFDFKTTFDAEGKPWRTGTRLGSGRWWPSSMIRATPLVCRAGGKLWAR